MARIIEFKGQSTLKRAAMNMLVQMISQDEVKDLRAQFEAMDTGGTGMIDIKELTEVLTNKGIKIDVNQLNSIISEIDYYGNKQINYSDFLSATINIRVYMTEQKLQAIFDQFDTDDSGYITHENIFFAMQKLGQSMTKQ